MPDYNIKIGGDSAEGMRAISQTREAMQGLTEGTTRLSAAMSGNLIAAASGGLNALKGLWAMVAANPLLALASLLALVVGKFHQMREASAAAAKQVADDIRKMTNPEEGMSRDARAQYFAKQGEAELRRRLDAAEAKAASAGSTYQTTLVLGGSAGGQDVNSALKAKMEAEAEVAALRDQVNQIDAERRSGRQSSRDELAKRQADQRKQIEDLQAQGAEKQRSLTMAGMDDAGKASAIRREIAALEEDIRSEMFDAVGKERMKNQLLDKRIELLDVEGRMAEAAKQAQAKKLADDLRVKANADAEAVKRRDAKARADEKAIADAEKLADDDRRRELRAGQRGAADYLQDLRNAAGARGNPALAATRTAVTKDQQQREQMLKVLQEIRDRSGLAP